MVDGGCWTDRVLFAFLSCRNSNPKTGLLFVILSLVYMKGGVVPEGEAPSPRRINTRLLLYSLFDG